MYYIYGINHRQRPVSNYWKGVEHMFVAMSRFVVANGMSDKVREAFANRPGLVDSVQGFLRMEVLNAEDNQDEFWLITYWEQGEQWREWYHGQHYKDSHSGIPKGLKLDPSATMVRTFECIPC